MMGHIEPWNYGLSFYFRAIEEANEYLKPVEDNGTQSR